MEYFPEFLESLSNNKTIKEFGLSFKSNVESEIICRLLELVKNNKNFKKFKICFPLALQEEIKEEFLRIFEAENKLNALEVSGWLDIESLVFDSCCTVNTLILNDLNIPNNYEKDVLEKLFKRNKNLTKIVFFDNFNYDIEVYNKLFNGESNLEIVEFYNSVDDEKKVFYKKSNFEGIDEYINKNLFT